jgi:hypothetical protein
VWLDSDADEPMETRAVFNCRFLTSHEIDAYTDELAEIAAMQDYEEAHRKLTAFLAKGVVGWKNVREPDNDSPLDFAPDRFDRVLTRPEKFDLAHLMLTRPRATEIELKKSASSTPTDAASSATPAGEQSDA